MVKKRKNCWEYMKCGREPGGVNVTQMGICPASVAQSCDGINSGICGGRFCWAVAGTMCNGKVQGTFAEKRKSCSQCTFYRQVRAEEGSLNIRTKFLRFVQPGSQTSLLNNLVLEKTRQGDRFIVQGNIVDKAYVIQQGSCIELVEKKGEIHPVGHRGEGDIVGMISLLTGEPMGFHVEAETDMDLWAITKENFETIPGQDPDLFAFLTELVADRFDRKGPIAERTVGKYLITDILGRGGYSIVYKGLHTELEMPVAIKMMRHHFSMRSDFMSMFQNEAKIIAGLNHQNIVKVFDIESRFKTVFIIYEFLQGESLSDMIARLKAIPVLLAFKYLRQMVSAMAYAGDKGLIHRDINPSNVIILYNDQIKLIDFGLACLSGTDDFQIGGNFNYLAPEQFDGEPADFRSDIFSLGITAFQMLTGHLPFSTQSPARLMQMISSSPVPDPGTIVKNLPEKLRYFIVNACKKDPAQRFQTPAQVLKWLDAETTEEKIVRSGYGDFCAKQIPAPAKKDPILGLNDKNRQTITFEIVPGKEKEFSELLDEFEKSIKQLGGSIFVKS
ncbi:MAG: protein kinase [Desulfamplus sp.]|nr:protein kinase [Desulfamplus sp.]